MSRVDIDIDVSGPMFDGRASKAAEDLVNGIEREVAEFGADMVRAQLDRVLKRPTGRYRRSIHVQSEFGAEVVTDGGIVYGPWLEGTGSRNRTTRFKGYSTYRRVAQYVDERSEEIAQALVPAYLRRMQ